MKKFKLNGSQYLNVELSPTLAETLDESLDNMTITLLVNEDEKPYAPILNVIGVYDVDENNNETLINEFVISSDSVDLATQNPLRYKHTISLIQKSQFLTHHLIRNNVFTNEASIEDIYSFSIGGWYFYDYATQEIKPYGLPSATIDLSKVKLNSLTMTINAKVFYLSSYSQTAGWGYDPDYGKLMYTENNNATVHMSLSNSRWSDLYVNSTSDVVIQKIKFTNNGVTKEWELDEDQQFNQKINVPEEIMEWIKTLSGTLTISVDSPFPTDLTGFVTFPSSAANFPICGTITYNFFDSLTSSNNVYKVIEQLLNQYKKNTKAYNDHVGSSGYDSTIQPLFKMPDNSNSKRAELKELLESTQAPNFVFTQATMFDALAEIFKLFDATFRIDEDGYLEIEYFNDRDYQLKFEMKPKLLAGRTTALGEERYSNRLVSFFQNAKVKDKFPNDNEINAMAYLRSKTLGVPSADDFVFEVPKPIDVILKAYIQSDFTVNSFSYNDPYIQGGELSGFIYSNFTFTDANFSNLVDITYNVVEASIWSTLPSQPTQTIYSTTKYKENTLSYARGSKYIEVANYYDIKENGLNLNTKTASFQNVYRAALYRTLGVRQISNTQWSITENTSPNWQNVKMSVDYIALVDGKLVNESIDNKYNGELLTNQDNGSIDIYKLGLNMVGLSLKLGQPTLTMTQKFTSWDKRIKKGQWFVENGEMWVANTCSYTLVDNEHVQATIEFVKNFNALASRIELNREKRLSNISNELTVKCEENYGEFVYFTDNINYILPTGQTPEPIAFMDYILKETIPNTFGFVNIYQYMKRIEYALIEALDDEGNTIELENGTKVEDIAIPMVIYGSGTSVCFEMSFESPISAGNQLLDQYICQRQAGVSVVTTAGWFSRAVLYAREDGTAEKFTIKFVTTDEELTRLFPVMKKQITVGSNYNESNLEPLDMITWGQIEEFEYFKKPNEIFALNYQLHFLPYRTEGRGDCFLGNEFFKNNAFSEGLNRKKLRIAYITTTGYEYSILDTKAVYDEDCDIDWDNVSIDTSENYKVSISIRFTGNYPLQVKAWAIVDEDDNIYFASNNGVRAVNIPGQLPKFYVDMVFFWRHHRI